MKSEEWKSYRTRFLVNAKQLNSTLSFVDHLGRQHRGRKGDYLVESSDGVVTIAPRHIFEDIYVPMPLPKDAASGQTGTDLQEIGPGKMGPVKIGLRKVGLRKVGLEPGTGRRKLPQPSGDRRTISSRLSLM